MFQRFSLWLRTDPSAGKKIVFIILAVVIVVGLGYGLFVLNFGTPGVNNQNNQVVLPTKEVTNTNFSNVPELTLVQDSALPFPSRIFFDTITDDIYYVDQNFKLNFNHETIFDSPDFIPITAFSTNNNTMIINEENFVTLYLRDSEQFLSLPSDVRFLTPVSNSEFYFATQEESAITINRTNNVGRTSFANEIDTIIPFNNFDLFEIRSFGGRPYLFVYQAATRQGGLEIWQIENQDSRLVFEINDLESLAFSQKQLLVSAGFDNFRLRNTLLDLSRENPIETEIDLLDRFAEQRISGDILASRCTFRNDQILTCLVKETSTEFYNSGDKDVLVDINLESRTINLSNRDLIFSGETLHFSPNGNLFVVSQEDRQLYRFNF